MHDLPSTSDRHAAFLGRVNADLPPGRDWKAGALSYLEDVLAGDRDGVARFVLTKPLHHAVGPEGMAEAQWYLRNFVELLELIGPRRGARCLDVACGGGWLSHFLTRLGFETMGFDISSDFVAMAKRRLSEDQNIDLSADAVDRMFVVHDIENEPLDPTTAPFDVIVLESCLHHFHDPVTAMRNLGAVLADDGIMVCIEGENRVGPIKEEYLEVMRQYSTIERPYHRVDLIEGLELAGFPAVEFVASVGGWRSPRDPASADLAATLERTAASMNLAVCAKSEQVLASLFPFRAARGSDTGVTFGVGFFADEGSHRWAGPSAELTTDRARRIVLDVILNAADAVGQSQEIVAYGRRGPLASVTIEPGRGSASLDLGSVGANERVVLCSSVAFDPSWRSGRVDRLLSFAVRLRTEGGAEPARTPSRGVRPAAGSSGASGAVKRLLGPRIFAAARQGAKWIRRDGRG